MIDVLPPRSAFTYRVGYLFLLNWASALVVFLQVLIGKRDEHGALTFTDPSLGRFFNHLNR
ncbi:MAG: hypothetical protein K0Q56_1685 [Sporolactobacillus laevolacticus]|jgi:hypothetical protein|nr:hypothetical protein [Sporolactobacillus laevolacticus]